MEGILCYEEYVGKAGATFNMRLKNHRKDVQKAEPILAYKQFQQESYNLNKHAQFTIIDQLMNTSKSKETSN